jgi:hypothetical protein
MPPSFPEPGAHQRRLLRHLDNPNRLRFAFDPAGEAHDVVRTNRLGEFYFGARIDEEAERLTRLDTEFVLAVKRDERVLQITSRHGEIGLLHGTLSLARSGRTRPIYDLLIGEIAF